MNVDDWLTIILAGSAPITIVAVVWNRIKTQKSIGVRAIQFLAIALLLPLIALLAIRQVLEGSVVGTLFGGLLGYLLANFSNYDKEIEGRASKARRERADPPRQPISRDH